MLELTFENFLYVYGIMTVLAIGIIVYGTVANSTSTWLRKVFLINLVCMLVYSVCIIFYLFVYMLALLFS